MSDFYGTKPLQYIYLYSLGINDHHQQARGSSSSSYKYPHAQKLHAAARILRSIGNRGGAAAGVRRLFKTSTIARDGDGRAR